jgi:hypothetical protein
MTATQDQISALGKAARGLLQFAWARTPRIDLLVINGLTAVAKTFATDPVASTALLRQAIGPVHLKEQGYKELRWIAQQISAIAQSDPVLAIDIYSAAFGYAETSGDATDMSNSAILSLRSNRRQDYQGAWFLLSEAIPAILNDNIEAGVRAVVRALDGYVQRERHFDPFPGEPATGSFLMGSTIASFKADWSHSWYRAGFQPVQDGPSLLKKFDECLQRLASDGDGKRKIGLVLTALSRETTVVAAIWGSLLVAGTQHPSMYAQPLLSLACAAPVMLSSDTRFQLGTFIRAAYEYFSGNERAAIERAILALPSEQAAERNKAALAGCIPIALVATVEMQTYIETLEQESKTRANVPPFQIISSVRTFDTDAYLASEGVSLEDPESAALRQLMRGVEALSPPGHTLDLTLKSVKRQLGVLQGTRPVKAALRN